MKTNINLRKINSNFDEINAFDQEGLTALHKAAIKGDKNTVRTLLSKGANIDLKTQDDNGCTALHIAAAYGHEDVVQTLLNYNAEINAFDQEGLTALHIAARKGDENIVRILLNKGANINLKAQNDNGWTALHYAAMQGGKKNIEILLNYNAEINAFDQEGLTALHIAAIKGDKNTVRTLLSKGANIDLKTQDDNGCTALHIAAAYGNNEVVQFLCENGADISSKDNLGYTPFYYAVEKDCVDGSADLVNSFASKISLSNARGSCENTPNTDLIFKESFFTNLSEAAKAENQNEKNDRQPYFLVSPAYVYNHRGQVLAELQRYKQMQFVTAEFHTDPFSEIKNIIAQANQSSDNKLSDQEIGLAILLAIRNNGISGTKTAQTSCQNDLQNKSLIATVLGEDYAPENQAELMQKIQNFSIAFQKAAKTHKFFTGNENAKEIVGMRLKRINPEIALDFILNSQNQSHAAARSNNFERAKILTDFDIENRLELHEITPSPSTSSPSISAVQANASLRYK